ncbi:unnamed protein product [Orchesella dallaii]|uniref:Ubiquitin-like protease family profile domain-containing protein n=1 Tax=Orchesella dallaii TaxID=48710 RepID=A0ABP1RWN3_9HEXA
MEKSEAKKFKDTINLIQELIRDVSCERCKYLEKQVYILDCCLAKYCKTCAEETRQELCAKCATKRSTTNFQNDFFSSSVAKLLIPFGENFRKDRTNVVKFLAEAKSLLSKIKGLGDFKTMPESIPQAPTSFPESEVAVCAFTKSNTSETEGEPESALRLLTDPGSAVLLYEGKNNVKMSICPNDISCLRHSKFLNDQIIAFWLEVIQTELLNDNDKKRTFVFDSFFYSKLTEKVKKRTAEKGSMSAAERRHARVKKRTKNVDIFEKDFLIVPINENSHWFIAIICFPGLQGYHDYNSLELLPNYKRMKSSKTSGRTMISIQPKKESTASYSNGDEAPEDEDEIESQMSTEPEDECSSPAESKIETDSNHRRNETGGGLKRKSEFGQGVKHPCILIFDSYTRESRGRVFSTLREYLKIEYKTKKQGNRVYDKTTMPGCMPKVPQQPNKTDCGLYLLQYVESFFSSPIQNFETLDLSLKNWFQTSIVENKRREIYEFILKKVEQLYPQNLARIPTVNFEPGDDNLNPEPPLHTEDDDSDNSLYPEPPLHTEDDDSGENLNPEPPLHTEDDDSDDLLETVPSKGNSESHDHNFVIVDFFSYY